MKQHLLGLLCFFMVPSAFAYDGVYLGVEVGHVGVRNSRPVESAIAYGVDLGIPTDSYIDLLFRFQYGFHDSLLGGSGTKWIQASVAAVATLVDYGQFRLALEGGPGFYFFDSLLLSNDKFGVHGGVIADVVVNDQWVVGLSTRLHWVFDNDPISFDTVAVMLRVGWVLD